MATEYISEVQLPGDANYKKVKDSEARSLISTCQSNILYTLNRTGKNLLRELPTQTINGVTLTNNGDGTYTITRTATSTSLASFIFGNNDNGRLTGCKMTGGASGYGLKSRAADGAQIDVSTDWTTAVTISATAVGNISVNVDPNENPQNVQIRPFVCDAEMYAKDPSFTMPALPNYDLTRLEAEDRAGLVECVDGGAKNILAPTDLVPYGDGLTNNPNLTCTNNGDGTYTLNGSTVGNGRIIIHHAITSAVYGGKMLSGCPNINTGSEKCRLSIYTDTGASGVCHDAGQGNEIPTSFNPAHLAIYVFSGNTFNNVKFYPMICTKAAFGVSKAFVPYRPNYDFVCSGRVAPRTSATLTSGNLNDFPTSYYLCTGAVANLPEYTGYAIVKTIVIDENAALQEAFTLNSSGNKSYMRTKWAGTWNPWVLNTNASS